MNSAQKTRWWVVAAAYGAGVIGAAHIGKVPAALPAMRADFGLDLIAASWVVAIFSVTGVLFGMAAGLLTDRLGHRVIAVGGVVLMALGSGAGALSESAEIILLTRFVEGVGYIIAVVSAPAIIAEAAAPADRRLASGMWGSFMPLGMAAMLLASPFLQEWAGWRGSWAFMAGVTALWAVLMMAVFGRSAAGDGGQSVPEHPWRNLLITVSARGPWLLALCFGFYTLAWVALMVWLPTFMIEERGLPVRLAALMTLVAVAVNLPGNLLGGWLMHKAAPRGVVIGVAALFIGISGPLIFLDHLPDGARFAACLVYSFAVGVAPATILGAAPYFAPSPRQIGTTYGLIIQGSHLGQLLGPVVVAMMVTITGGWQAGAWVFVACGVGVLWFAGLIAREEARAQAPNR